MAIGKNEVNNKKCGFDQPSIWAYVDTVNIYIE